MHDASLSWLSVYCWAGSHAAIVVTAGADRHQWLGLSQLCNLSQSHGLNLNVVPAREDGNIGNACLPTETLRQCLPFMKTRS